MTKKELYDKLYAHDIYLSKYKLEKALEFISKFETERKGFNALLKEEKFNKYNNERKGGYSAPGQYESHLKSVRKKVVGTDQFGRERTYNSIYEAAKMLGKPKGFGNISAGIRSGNRIYGYKWEFKNK